MNVSKMRRVLAAAAIAVLGFLSVAAAQETVSPKEVVAKVREAANTLSESKDLAQFNRKSSQWVWKDTYIFVEDCEKGVLAAHPLRSDLVGRDLGSLKDPKGTKIFPDPKGICEAAQKPSGTWVEYQWPRPGKKEASRKISYLLGAKGTPYVVGAGIYDEKTTIPELSKVSEK